MRKLLILSLILFSPFAYSGNQYWNCTYPPGNYADPYPVAQALFPTYTSGSYTHTLQYDVESPTQVHYSDHRCHISNGSCVNLNGQTCNKETCPAGQEVDKDSGSVQCVPVCTSPQVRNPLTGQCQNPCPVDSPHQSATAMSGSYMTPNPANVCLNGCVVQYTMPNAGTPCRIVGCSGQSQGCLIPDEYDCMVVNTSGTGEFCTSGDTFVIHPPTSCPAGWYLSGGACMHDPVCTETQQLIDHACVDDPVCDESSHIDNHQCVPDPSCDENEVKQGHQCVPLQCEPGQVASNHQCSDPVCDGENEHREGHYCLPDPSCDDDERKEGHVCVPVVCGLDQEPRNHQCVPVECESGFTYSFILHQCVLSDSCPDGSHRSGLSCVSDDPPTKQCSEGSYLDAGVCKRVPDVVCPVGTTKVGESCISVVRPACASGSHLDGSQCVSDSPPDVHCPAGTHAVGSGCDSDSPPTPPSCGAGSHLEGSQCVSDTGPDTGGGCGAGQHNDGGKCVHDTTPAPTCSVGESLVGNVCVVNADHVVKTCRPGESLQGEYCVKDSPPTCATGQTLVDGNCVAQTVQGCPEGSKLTNGLCVQGAQKTCGSGEILVGGQCIVSGVNPGTGGDTGGETGNGTCDPATEECGEGAGVKPFESLYEKKEQEFSDVWGKFVTRVQAAPIVNAGVTFFTMPSISASCPIWTIPSTYISPAITIDLQCSQAMLDAFSIAATIMLAVCAWVAFRMAFL